MKKAVAEKYRNIDFSRAKRGPVITPEPGKTKISIRLDNTVLEYFRNLVDRAGGGNYQTLINDALLEHVHRRSTLDVVRQVVREELASYRTAVPDRGGQLHATADTLCAPLSVTARRVALDSPPGRDIVRTTSRSIVAPGRLP